MGGSADRDKPRLNPALRQHARRLRADCTDAEARLWTRLRARRLGGHKFRRQCPLHGYILDFYCEAARVAVELDGRQHGEDEVVAYDERRTAALARLGIRVLRFPNEDVLRDADWVLARILEALEEGG